MRRFAPLVVLCSGWLGCSSVTNPTTIRDVSPSRTPSAGTSTGSFVAPNPPEWFVNVASSWVETTETGVHRGVTTLRFESRGRKIIGIADEPGQLDGAHAAPPWTPAGPCKYIFWHDNELHGSAEWLGAARLITKVPSTIYASFDWFGGAGVMTNQGLFVVNTSTCAVDKLKLPNVAAAYAASSSRALVLTALGHARLTLDEGKSYKDVSTEMPQVGLIERVHDELHVTTATDESFVVNNQGIISREKFIEDRHQDKPDFDPEDRWPNDNEVTSALEAAVGEGLLLPNGEALGANNGLVARVQLKTGRASEMLRIGSSAERCSPVAVNDRALVVCESGRTVSVLDAGSGNVERSFDVEQEIVWDRFVVADGEALGFVGPCGGRNPGPPVDVVATASPASISTQRSAAFCVRTPDGSWVEHKLDAIDATDVLAWIPQANGAATAIIALTGTFLHGVTPVEVRGRLRIVRIARNAPPIDISAYNSESAKLVSHALHVLPDGTVEGWLSSGHGPSGVMSVKIDPQGRPEQRPVPARTTSFMTNGRFAVARTEEGRYFETTDFGRTFQAIDPPPGHQGEPMAVSSVGAQFGPYLRVGWGSHAKPLPPPDSLPSETYSTLRRKEPPVVRLACRFSGPPNSGRIPDGQGLGLSKTPMAQMSSGRLQHSGAFFTPWRGLPNAMSGNAEFIFMPLFDLTTPVRRATIPLSKLEGDARLSHEIRLGFILDENTVWPVPAERFSRCPAALTDAAGLTMPMGVCVDDPTTGIVVDGKLYLIHPDIMLYGPSRYSSLTVTTADFTADRSGKTPPRASNVKQLAMHHVSGGIHRYAFAPGRRGKTPVIVALEGDGSATMTTIDPTHGRLGAEEPLASLSTLQLGTDPRCKEAPNDVQVLLSFTHEIGLHTQSLPGIRDTEHGGLAILRWSKERVCLDAIDINVTDERHESDLMIHVPQGPIRKIVDRFDKTNAGKGSLALITYATEVRQPVVCEGASP